MRKNVHLPSLTLAVNLLVSPHNFPFFLFTEGRDYGYSTWTFTPVGPRQREGWLEALKQPELCPNGLSDLEHIT